MLINNKSRIATNIILLLKKNEQLRCPDLAKELHKSNSYIEQICKLLNDAGLVQGLRGPGGGYCLEKEPHEISFADIVAAIFPQPENEKGEWGEISKKLRICSADIRMDSV